MNCRIGDEISDDFVYLGISHSSMATNTEVKQKLRKHDSAID